MIEVVLNDRLGKKVRFLSLMHLKSLFRLIRIFYMQIRVKCNEDDTVGDLKKLVAAQTGIAAFCILKVSLVRVCSQEVICCRNATGED